MKHVTDRDIIEKPETLEELATPELTLLRNHIEAILTRRELEEREPSESRQEVVEEKPASAGTLRSEMVKCGKDRCRKCAEGLGHGPYWYLYFRRNGKLTSKYIGKELPDDPAV